MYAYSIYDHYLNPDQNSESNLNIRSDQAANSVNQFNNVLNAFDSDNAWQSAINEAQNEVRESTDIIRGILKNLELKINKVDETNPSGLLTKSILSKRLGPDPKLNNLSFENSKYMTTMSSLANKEYFSNSNFSNISTVYSKLK
ncbi:hypothetical protein GJ496_004351 [Pomphorhynchus laevis]|nr:hypothetical protein GJ496_004351 [Pomphorhynchus laevis]